MAALCLQLRHLDDRTFIGERSSVVSLLHSLLSKGPNYGLCLNLKKCKVFWPTKDQTFSEFPPEVQRVAEQEEGKELLGSPIYENEEFLNQLSKNACQNWSMHKVIS